MKKSLFTSFTLCLVVINSFAQTPCEQKLKNAKNSIIAIINSGGGNDKINQTAADVMTNMALNCPESIDEFNKFIQSLGKKGNTDKDLDGKVKGDYQTNQERQKALEEYNKQNTQNSAGQGANNTGSQNNNNSNRTGNNQSRMRGDGYAELPFKENDNKNSTIQYTNGDDEWIDTKKTIRKNSTNGGGVGISGKTVEQQRQNEQYRNQAHNQIQNGKGGFKPVEDKGDLISPKGNLESEIQNFEKKLANIPENLKPDLLAKANHILNTVTNQTEAARKLANLMTEFEKNNKNVIAKAEKTENNVQVNHTSQKNTTEGNSTIRKANIEDLKTNLLNVFRSNCSSYGTDEYNRLENTNFYKCSGKYLYSIEGDYFVINYDLYVLGSLNGYWDRYKMTMKYDLKKYISLHNRNSGPIELNGSGHTSGTIEEKDKNIKNFSESTVGLPFHCSSLKNSAEEIKKLLKQIYAYYNL